MLLVLQKLGIQYKMDAGIEDWVNMNAINNQPTLLPKPIDNTKMPLLKGMGLKDVVVMCETMGLKVQAKGKGKVASQSINAGEQIARGQIVNIELN
jgi:cell division protein FtsI (penicillin-binding protein 3)